MKITSIYPSLPNANPIILICNAKKCIKYLYYTYLFTVFFLIYRHAISIYLSLKYIDEDKLYIKILIFGKGIFFNSEKYHILPISFNFIQFIKINLARYYKSISISKLKRECSFLLFV